VLSSWDLPGKDLLEDFIVISLFNGDTPDIRPCTGNKILFFQIRIIISLYLKGQSHKKVGEIRA
jgi:hypothetical protein